MEKFIQNSGKALAEVRARANEFLNERIGGNRTNLIFFTIAVFILLILSVSAILNFQSLIDNYKIYLVLLSVMVLAILWVAIFYESESHLKDDGHDFRMEPLKRSRIKYHLIHLQNGSKREFERLLVGKNVEDKINFTMGNKSGDSANHRILFVLFDEMIIGGVKDMTGERKDQFFHLLMNSFLMNGEPIKESTLKTSFSTWKNEQEKINSRNQRKLIQQMLGKA